MFTLHPGIIKRVLKCEDPPFRPISVMGKLMGKESDGGDSIVDGVWPLMQACWAEAPSTRPKFSEIKTLLRNFNKGRWVHSPSFVEWMIVEWMISPRCQHTIWTSDCWFRCCVLWSAVLVTAAYYTNHINFTSQLLNPIKALDEFGAKCDISLRWVFKKKKKALFFILAHSSSDGSTWLWLNFHSRRVNIMDNMIGMMEKYANNLEELVQSRTSELIDQKKKTDMLLYSMLPRFVCGAYV